MTGVAPRPRHRHVWLRMQTGGGGKFECMCGAIATITPHGLIVNRARKAKP